MTPIQEYVPILKTTRAELVGLRQLPEEVKDNVTPLFELTKSRKSKAFADGDVNQQLAQVGEAFQARPFFLDLTGHPKYRNSQIRALQASGKGYRNWVKFLREKRDAFPNLMPVLQANDEDVDTAAEFYSRLCEQARVLSGEFPIVVYRFPIDYEDYEADFEQLLTATKADKLMAVLDGEFIPQNKASVYAETAAAIVNRLAGLGIGTVAVAGSSFPQNPIQYGNEDQGCFDLEELTFFADVERKSKQQLIYSDYATIHPAPSLQAGGRGWVPRIDLPCKKSLLYRRSRKNKGESTYKNAYIRAAKRVVSLPDFSTVSDFVGDSWGLRQIELAAGGFPPALSPSLWISARVSIHIAVRIATG